MDRMRKLLLQNHQDDIIRDLDVKYIIDELFSQNALTSEEFDDILNVSERKEQTRLFLEMLQDKNIDAFQAFVDSLMKDYNWLWQKLQVPVGDQMDNVNDILRESLEDSLQRGDVPRLPSHYVNRSQLNTKVLSGILDLKRHKCLVLHGMSGSGKSTMAAGLLRQSDRQVLYDFTKGHIFWINVGDCHSDEWILDTQIRLHRKAVSQRNKHGSSNYIVSSISLTSLGSSIIESSELSWQHFIENLRSVFEDGSLRESLIILDDVVDRKVVQAFDLGCKLLITTRDLELVQNISPRVINVPNSLEESESLAVLGACLQMPASDLPKQAQTLHRITKGAPLLIALLGSLLKENRERLMHDNNHWNYYTKKLTNKEYSITNTSNGNFEPFKAIEMCVTSLPAKMQNRLNMLLVLPVDSKIGAKALSTIWQEPISDVENVMKYFKNKSLVIEYFDVEQLSYLYEIHDLVLLYLRSSQSVLDQQAMHRLLIDRYKDKEYYLTDDGYIAYYIGYHLENTQDDKYWKLLNELYLDLDFLGWKLRLAGPSSLLRDIDLYEKRIANNEKQRELISDLRVLVSSRGVDLRRFPLTTLSQTILQYCGPQRLPALYKAAIAAATNKPTQLHFTIQRVNAVGGTGLGLDEEEQFTSVEVHRRVTAVCFCYNHFIIGDQLGNISIYEIWLSAMQLERSVSGKRLSGDGNAVLSMSCSPADATQLVTLTADGQLTLLKIEDNNEDGVSCMQLYSKTLEWWSPEDVSFGLVSWSCDGSALLVCNKRTLTLFSLSGDTLLTHSLQKEASLSAAAAIIYNPASDDKRNGEVVLGCTISEAVHLAQVIDSHSGECLVAFKHTSPILQLAFLHGTYHSVLSLTSSKLTKLSWPDQKEVVLIDVSERNAAQPTRLESMLISEDMSKVFLSAGNNVLLYQLPNGNFIRRLHHERGIIIGMDIRSFWSEEHSSYFDLLLLASEDEPSKQRDPSKTHSTVRLWYINPSIGNQLHNTSRSAKLTSLFDCSFSWVWSGGESPLSDKRPPLFALSSRRGASTASLRLQDQDNGNNHYHSILRKTSSLERRGLLPLTLRQATRFPLTAAIDEDEHLQIFYGRSRLRSKAQFSGRDRVTRICVSGKTGRVYTGHLGGAVMEHQLYFGNSPVASSPISSKKVMDLGASVHYLALVGGVVLCAGAKDGRLMAFRLPSLDGSDEGRALMLLAGATELGSSELLDRMAGRHPPFKAPPELGYSDNENNDCDEGLKCLSRASPVLCCLWVEGRGLVSVHTSGAVKLWSILGGGSLLGVLEVAQLKVKLTCCAHLPGHLLVLAEQDGTFRIYEWQDNGPELCLSLLQRHQVANESVTCCDITADGALVALGLSSGSILLWHVTSARLIQTLLLHRSAVQSVRFSPPPSTPPPLSPLSPRPGLGPPPQSREEQDGAHQLLLSLAGQLVCWDVTLIRINNARAMLQRRRDSGIMNGSVNAGVPPVPVLKTVFWETPWMNKKGCIDNRPEIVSCMKLSGEGAGALLADETFSCVALGDRAGDLLLLVPFAATSQPPLNTPP